MSDTPAENAAPQLAVIHEEQQAMTPTELLQMAVTQGADVDKLTKLVELQERWEANQARKAFNAAMKKFKENPPELVRNRGVSFNTTNYRYATLDSVVDAITDGLSAVGITHRWKSKQAKDWVTVTCVLTHELGHSEETTLEGPPDTSGSKNAIQAIASAVTYLERYTLKMSCGLAEKNDTDGVAPPETPSVDNSATYEEAYRQMTEVETVADLMKVFGKAYNVAQEAHDREAMNKLIQFKNKRTGEIKNAHR